MSAGDFPRALGKRKEIEHDGQDENCSRNFFRADSAGN